MILCRQPVVLRTLAATAPGGNLPIMTPGNLRGCHLPQPTVLLKIPARRSIDKNQKECSRLMPNLFNFE